MNGGISTEPLESFRPFTLGVQALCLGTDT